MRYGLEVTTDPTAEPLSLDEIKTYLRVDSSDEDDLLLGLIVAARQYCEAVTKRSFVTQTMKAWYDDFPSGGELELPRPFDDTTSLPSIAYYTVGSSAATTFASTNYWVDAKSLPGRIVLKDSATWPDNDLRTVNAVEVTLQSGYGGESDVPDGIKTAMRLLIGHWYANREAVVVGTITNSLEMAVAALLSPHIVPFVA